MPRGERSVRGADASVCTAQKIAACCSTTLQIVLVLVASVTISLGRCRALAVASAAATATITVGFFALYLLEYQCVVGGNHKWARRRSLV